MFLPIKRSSIWSVASWSTMARIGSVTQSGHKKKKMLFLITPQNKPTTVVCAGCRHQTRPPTLTGGSINHSAACCVSQNFAASDRIIGASIKVLRLSDRRDSTAPPGGQRNNQWTIPKPSEGFNYSFGNKNVVSVEIYWRCQITHPGWNWQSATKPAPL